MKTEKLLEKLNSSKKCPEFFSGCDINPEWDAEMSKLGWDNDADWEALKWNKDSSPANHYTKLYRIAQETVRAQGIKCVEKEYTEKVKVVKRDNCDDLIISADYTCNNPLFDNNGLLDEENRDKLEAWLKPFGLEWDHEMYWCLILRKA